MNEDFKISERLKEIMQNNRVNLSRLSELSNISKSSLHDYLKGKTKPKQQNIHRLAKALNVSETYLMGWTESPIDNPAPNTIDFSDIKEIIRTKKIPLIGNICAGEGLWADENFERMIVIDENTISADYALRVKGDSMIDANILDGDIVFLNKEFNFVNGDIYAVIVKGEDLGSLKKVHKQGKNLILEPCNKNYSPQVYNIDEVFICGKYKGLLREN